MRLSPHEITTEFIDAGELRFETHVCGDAASPRLALCLHGFPEHAFSWRHQLPVLASLGYRVWAPNQRGYGRTTPLSGNVDHYHMDHLLKDVAALVRVAEAESVTLIGHDWGGVVAWIFALREVAPLENLVIMNLPHPKRFREALLTNAAQKRRSRYERFFQLPWLPEFLFRLGGARAVGQAFRGMAVNPDRFSDDDLRVYREQAMKPGHMKAMLDWYRANPFLQVCDEAWPKLDTRTLMIWGEQDTALGKEMTERTDELVRDFTIRYLHASHWVQQDAPDEVNTILSAWLMGQPVPDLG